jgi:quinol monooxygenase YgiN
MPALPWVEVQTPDANRRYVAMASRLPLRSHIDSAAFLLDTMRIRRQLDQADGLVGYALNAQITRKTFWTFSVWTDRQSLDAFAAADPHRQIIERLRPKMGESRFEFLQLSGAEIPKTWDERMDPVR